MCICHYWHNANRIVICVSFSLTQCQWHQNSNVCICYHWYNANTIRIVNCDSNDRYTHYYSDGISIVSVMTDAHITILMALVLYQSWQIHILLFWWHWHCVVQMSCDFSFLISLTVSICQNSNQCICYHGHNANAIRIVICVSVITDTMSMPIWDWAGQFHWYGVDVHI
jgi:hypothetical protein